MNGDAKWAAVLMLVFWIASLVIFAFQRDVVLLVVSLLVSVLLAGVLALIFGAP